MLCRTELRTVEGGVFGARYLFTVLLGLGLLLLLQGGNNQSAFMKDEGQK
jgi:hypothetical protein